MKSKINTYIIIVVILFFFSSCSWQEYFIVKNNSDSSILVTYTISQANGFPIFDNMPGAYMSAKSSDIDWNKEIVLEDKDTSALGFQFTLPPRSILKFGHLSNDNYSNKNQYFINDRIFNFETMEIKKKDEAITITKDKFDSFFKKENGYIVYEIK